ncbi:uncharacterized protein MELLADRAFT_107897 [Melampsora larici-populina 98AG31]|uniref:SWIM-type domain-containing protein n=1 Tax=Melampsora larici-populina (strain 98AG31 / pathotype 3-4-7) TaxID=747676 RepID=F4RRB3_MELLP|nr:uncharacterized protein MELLADRAFT_107897 [Melampsora larici-populina 98AG31]EGG05064.1 hypothetical protein MELLADRAFT_107897 [Melampsora larici-populina 98AG31]
MTVVEDPSSIFKVDWLSGPYGNVNIDRTYAAHIRSKYPHLAHDLPQAWPKGLTPEVQSTTVSNPTPTTSDIESLVEAIPAEEADGIPNTMIEAHLTESSPDGPPDSWFGSTIEASVMCSVNVEEQAVTSCLCPSFKLTNRPCSHMLKVSNRLGIPIVLDTDNTCSPPHSQMPVITCKLLNGRKLVTECTCDVFQHLGQPCLHMKKMCQILDLEMYVLEPDHKDVSDGGSVVHSDQQINQPHAESSSSLPETSNSGRSQCLSETLTETLTHTDFTLPLVKSTRATVNRIQRCLSGKAITRLANQVSPVTMKDIEEASKRLERSITDALDSGRPKKQCRF